MLSTSSGALKDIFLLLYCRNVDNQLPGQAVPAGFPVYPAFNPLQVLWWRQMYAHQYYMQ